MAEVVKILTLPEVREVLEKEEEKDSNMTYTKKMALEHARLFAKIDPDKAVKLKEELMRIESVSEEYATKFVDMLPTHIDDVRAVFARERFEVPESDIKQVIEIIDKYRE